MPNSSILVRFNSEQDGSGSQDEAFEIISVAGTKSLLGDPALDRALAIARWCTPAAVCVTLVVLLASQSSQTPRSIRFPLVATKSDFAPLSDFSASVSDFLDRAIETQRPKQILPAPPKQDLLQALPDTSVSQLPPATRNDVLSLDDIPDAAGATRLENVASTSAPAALNPAATPSSTVKRGTFIPAILETPIDPSKPSGVRALIPVDVAGRAGGMMVPRSARLIGQYYARKSDGRQRVYIIWKQLVMPDGSIEPIPSGSISQEAFFESFGSASMISVVETEGPRGAIDRLSSGEPLRIITSKDVEIFKTGSLMAD